MKRNLLTIAIVALTVGLLGSCSKIDDRIDDLEKRIDGIESTRIASVEQQIAAINQSINDLKATDAAINGKIEELKTAAKAQQALIDALKEADNELGQKDEELEARIATLEGQAAILASQIKTLEEADNAIIAKIEELKSYVATELSKTKNWATATFATLEQYQQTADDLATLSIAVSSISNILSMLQISITDLEDDIIRIGVELREKLEGAISELEDDISSLRTEIDDKILVAIMDSEDSITEWVNDLLEGYYTAAKVDEKISALNTAIDAAKGTANERIDSVATELTALKEAVDTAKANIRVEYEDAIATAINEYDGEIRNALKDSILAVNGRIEALDTRVTSLESRMLAIEDNVGKLLAMIQSVSITPAYDDGSVEAVNGILTLKCIVSPAEALSGMESLKDSLMIYADSVKVKTKASPAYMEIKVSEASVLDAEQGAITLKADISEYLPKSADKALTVALNIRNGISNFTTEFVKVENVKTIAGILPENFPVAVQDGQVPDDAWISIEDNQKCYLATDGATLFFYNASGAPYQQYGVSTDTAVLAGNNNYVCTVDSVTITFNMQDGALSNIQFNDTSSSTWNGFYQQSACIAAGTLITMGNGEQKAVENLEIGDVIRTFDHKSGEVSSSHVCYIMESKNAVNAFTLTFEDGTSICIIEEHGFYDREEHKYAFINPRNAKDYIGHHFYNADNGKWLELKSCDMQSGSVDAYAIVTSVHLNHTSNGMLSMCDGTIEILANLFEYDDQMKFDEDKKNRDIEEYGLTPKEKVLEYEGFTESDYRDYNLQYLDIAVGKGLISWEWVKAFSDYCVANGI